MKILERFKNCNKYKVMAGMALAAASINAHALTIDTGFLTSIGCAIYEYLTGPLASWAFVVVIGGGIVMGLITSIDWGKIVPAVAIFAVVQSLGMIIIENPTAAKYLRTASCLRSS
nr:hypothetical protein [Comamonas testosteroni]